MKIIISYPINHIPQIMEFKDDIVEKLNEKSFNVANSAYCELYPSKKTGFKKDDMPCN